MAAPLEVLSNFLIIPESLQSVPLRKDGLPNLEIMSTEELAILHGAVGEAAERSSRVIRTGEISAARRTARETKAAAVEKAAKRQMEIETKRKELKAEAEEVAAAAAEAAAKADTHAALKLREILNRG